MPTAMFAESMSVISVLGGPSDSHMRARPTREVLQRFGGSPLEFTYVISNDRAFSIAGFVRTPSGSTSGDKHPIPTDGPAALERSALAAA